MRIAKSWNMDIKIGTQKQVRWVKEVGVEAFCGRGTYICVAKTDSGRPIWRSVQYSVWAKTVITSLVR